jgi:hypothetical protein
MKMSCGAYYNGVGFKIRGVYLYLVRAFSGETITRIQLNTKMIEELEKIKRTYDLTDIKRTQKVLELFKNTNKK